MGVEVIVADHYEEESRALGATSENLKAGVALIYKSLEKDRIASSKYGSSRRASILNFGSGSASVCASHL